MKPEPPKAQWFCNCCGQTWKAGDPSQCVCKRDVFFLVGTFIGLLFVGFVALLILAHGTLTRWW